MHAGMPRKHVQPRLIAAWRQLEEGSTAKAKAACRRVLRETPEDAAATHLLGLIHQAEGDTAFAERCLRLSVELEPAAADFRGNLGTLLLALGRPREAERACREALALDAVCRVARAGLVRALVELEQPVAAEREALELTRRCASDPESWTLLANALRDQGKIAEAEALYRKALELDPAYAPAHQELGAIWSRLERHEEALGAFRRARELGGGRFAIAREMGRVYLQMHCLGDAEEAFAEAVRAEPRSADAQLDLARTRFMRGDPAYARDIVSAAEAFGDDPCLATHFATLLRKVGMPERAERHLELNIRHHGRSPGALSALAGVQLELGRTARARAPILEAAKARPDDAGIAETAVAVLLACGEPELAWYYVAKHRARRPLDQGWLAYEAVTSRLLDPDRYRELYDFDRLVRVHDLETPAGFTSITELNAALSDVLHERHRAPTLPIDDSLRGGSRTMRSLLDDPHPALRAVMEAFAASLEDYRRALGDDGSHPVSARNNGAATITDAWSVELRTHGYHVNHFHRSGWISATYYVSAPGEARDTARMPGWMRLGEPRFPVPGANPERFIQPRPGRLVLFPSCMWHGSIPLEGPERRITISFDALPSRQR